MSKCLILQLDYYADKTGYKYGIFAQYFKKSIEDYAKKYNIDYNIIQYTAHHYYDYGEKIKLYKSLINNTNYEKILYLDMDVFINKNSPNIFDLETQHLSACTATRKRLDFGIDFTRKKMQNNSDNFWLLENNCVRPNGGVLLFNTKNIDKKIFDDDKEDIIEDEMYLAYKVAYKNLCINILPPLWNQRNLGLMKESYFIHVLSNLFNDHGFDSERNLKLGNIVNNLLEINNA